ncbi:non-specific lipid-transfer protein 1-like [Alnus glutinosa]|uniref:non-specific lipid-transfer protein 1-like n=1 Tax=Alnus glutinosa TaxID=3517 RepID=UPI002D76D358|nr:non-specific lipid-transfer protein 1-like [Alnus glutinosa]
MASSTSVFRKLTCVLLICMMACAPLAQAAVSCGTVQSSLIPCLPYVRNNGAGAVPPACCQGIASVNNGAKTTPDRQAVCECLKKLSSLVSGANPAIIAGLPGKCKVNVPYKISTSTNCKTVK